MIIFKKKYFLFLGIGIFLAGLARGGIEGYRLRVLSLIFMWAALAGCWNIMSGYTGYIDFGPVAYFGIGSYCTALLMIKGGLSFYLSLFLAGWGCRGLSVGLGCSTLRLQGAYFAIATFAAAEAMKQVILEWDRLAGFEFFGGAHGFTLPPSPPGIF